MKAILFLFSLVLAVFAVPLSSEGHAKKASEIKSSFSLDSLDIALGEPSGQVIEAKAKVSFTSDSLDGTTETILRTSKAKVKKESRSDCGIAGNRKMNLAYKIK